ncbi:MAG TPA: hypothetical protein ENI04_00465 [Candidatus Wildermuthbacteria bacterium]|nr:hypothetical protein [Patescibacteria group bacterium]HEA84445.1 hypothetical protein [Candidatus Wildermuthbacteria bacterium]
MKKFQNIIQIILLYIRRAPRIIGTHAFPVFLLLITLSLLISGSIFFFTVLSLRDVEPDIQGSKTAFKKEMFLGILDIWEKRSVILEETDTKVYEDLFEIR